MLKQLISLFAEKFLTSKKEWVAEQSAPNSTNAIRIPCMSTTDFFYYTTPCNGVITARTTQSTVAALEIQFGENRQFVLASNLSGTSAGFGIAGYFAKGTKICLLCRGGALTDYSIIFYPVGSTS